MKWIIPKCHRQNDVTPSTDFNSPLPENDGDGTVCVADPVVKNQIECGKNEADEDIRNDRVKTFDDPDDMLASLKMQW